jgi:hypothetical protein
MVGQRRIATAENLAVRNIYGLRSHTTVGTFYDSHDLFELVLHTVSATINALINVLNSVNSRELSAAVAIDRLWHEWIV